MEHNRQTIVCVDQHLVSNMASVEGGGGEKYFKQYAHTSSKYAPMSPKKESTEQTSLPSRVLPSHTVQLHHMSTARSIRPAFKTGEQARRERDRKNRESSGHGRQASDAEGRLRCGTTMDRPPLFADQATDGEERELPDDFWCVDKILDGPYLDSLGQQVFLVKVSGSNDYGEQVDGLVWELQSIDLPVKSRMEFLKVNNNTAGEIVVVGDKGLIAEAYDNATKHMRGFENTTGTGDDLTASETDSDDSGSENKWTTSIAKRTGKELSSKTSKSPKSSVTVATAASSIHSSVNEVSLTLDSLRIFISQLRRIRKPSQDHSMALKHGRGILSCVNTENITVKVGRAVSFQSSQSDGFPFRIGIVVSLQTASNSTFQAELMVYSYAPLPDSDKHEYFRKYSARRVPHCVLQTDLRETVCLSMVTGAVQLHPPLFWEKPHARHGDYYLLAGHIHPVPCDDQKDCVSPLCTSPSSRFSWASRIMSDVPSYVEMLKHNVQLRITTFLETRLRREMAGVLDILTIDNVPSAWLYVALGEQWVRDHEAQMYYQPRTREHRITGCTSDFIDLFGIDIKQTTLSNQSVLTDSVSGVLQIIEGPNGLPEVTMRWSPKQPGLFYVAFGALELLGPVQENGQRNTMWKSNRFKCRNAKVGSWDRQNLHCIHCVETNCCSGCKKAKEPVLDPQ